MKSLSIDSQIKKSRLFRVLFEIFSRLSKKRKIQILILLIFNLLNGFAEILTLASVFPFLKVITAPEIILQNVLLSKVLYAFNINSENQLIIFFVLVFIISIVFASIVKLVYLWSSSKLSAVIGSELSCELFKRNIYKPYESHFSENSGEIINIALVHVDKVVDLINAYFQLFNFFAITVFLLIGLLIFNFKITIFLLIIFSLAYLYLSLNSRKKLLRNSQLGFVASNKQIKVLQESFGSIRDTIINGKQLSFFNIFKEADNLKRQKIAQNIYLSTSPRYELEALGLILISLCAYFLSINSGSNELIIPVLGTLALGSQRLLPAMQGIYLAWAQINSLIASAIKTIDFLNIPIQESQLINYDNSLGFKSSIKLSNVCYRYPGTKNNVINNLNLEIFRGETIGLIGETGSGKSTLCDLIMGLLNPNSGSMLIDNKNIDVNLYPKRAAKWRSSISHVPQNIYLSDNSIAENIAFGIDSKEIDMKKVISASRKAQIANFVESLPKKYDENIGEKGIKLSGGQRQRIALARAFYADKRILFLDEATSALDYETERLVMEEIYDMKGDKTVFIIAHRKNTLSFCDRIINFKKGEIYNQIKNS